MAQKTKTFVCDRPFICPACKGDFDAGDLIAMLVPQRVRYCEPCAVKAAVKIDARSGATAEPASEVTTTRIEGGDKLQKALEQSNVSAMIEDALKRHFAKQPTAPPALGAMVPMERFLQFVDKSMASIIALEKQVAALEARLDALE